MECTQRLDFEPSQSQAETWRTCPDQIGFLGILGTKYPVVRGPNKIGRDPQTCNIVLNLNSISRQHAVINVLNNRDFMLMDLDSANKTRLNNKSLQPYLPAALSNGDTVQFGEAFGVFRLLEEDADLPSTQAIDLPSTQVLDVPDTPLQNKHADRFRQAVIPESPEVSDKDDSFIVPSQPKPGNKFKNPCNNFIKSSSKTISIQPIGSNKIDNVFWTSSKKSNSFNLDDSTSSLNDSRNGIDPPNGSTDSIYTAETQLPPAPSIHSQDTQLPAPDVLANKENIYNAETQLPSENDLNLARSKDDIFNAETQLPNQMSLANGINENIYDANTELPLDPAGENNDNIYEAETQLPPNKFNLSNKESKSIHEMDTQAPFPNDSTDSLYTAETQLPPVNSSPSIYSQATQLPKLNDFEIRDSPKSLHDVNTQLPFEAPNVSSKRDENIFEAETQLPTIEKEPDSKEINHIDNKSISHVDDEKQNVLSEEEEDIFNAETPPFEDFQQTSENKLKERLERSDDIINFDAIDAPGSVDDEVAETQNILDEFNAFQPVAPSPALPFTVQEESEDIPLSQSDTITDDDFQINLEENKIEVKPARRGSRTKSTSSTDCEDIEFLPTQKIPAVVTNEEDVTDCEEDTPDGKQVDNAGAPEKTANFEELATQVIPAAVPLHEAMINFEDLATQVIPETTEDNKIEKSKSTLGQKPVNEQGFEDMLTQVIPEENCDKDNIDDLPTQVIPEIVPSTSKTSILQCSEEVVANPFKIPLPTPLKAKRKDISKTSDQKSAKSPVAKVNADNNDDEKYYAATQEIYDDLCSQKDSAVDSGNLNNNHLKTTKPQVSKENESGEEDHKLGTKFQQFDGEIEISVKKFAKSTSSESSDGEEKISKLVKSLSSKQINEVIGSDVAPVKRVPSDPSDAEVTPKKVRPFRFMDTLLPDSQEIKTSVTLSTTTMATDSSSESEAEKESQELTPIVHRKKKRAKANVKIDLTAKFDVQSLPTRIITRTRKPTAKVQENDSTTKKRGRNILKPKFLNDTEQEDEVDTEIISENITRLKNKNDKKNHKDTTHNVPIEEVKAESNRKSNEENSDIVKRNSAANSRHKSKNSSKDTIVDLTVLDEVEKPKTRNRKERSKNNKEESVGSSKEEQIKHDTTKTDSDKHKEPQKPGRAKKKDVQDKITNYTVTTDDSRLSRSVNKVDDNLNANDSKNQSTKSTRQRNSDKNQTEKSVPVEQEPKRKRGRPRKEDNKTDSKTKIKEQNDSQDSKSAKKRKKDDGPDKEVKKIAKKDERQLNKT
ncbi:FHA domain-containing protein [Phthorimaea operculella]|nr:FHA domain-containing protein [Phthorimaea operculella]